MPGMLSQHACTQHWLHSCYASSVVLPTCFFCRHPFPRLPGPSACTPETERPTCTCLENAPSHHPAWPRSMSPTQGVIHAGGGVPVRGGRQWQWTCQASSTLQHVLHRFSGARPCRPGKMGAAQNRASSQRIDRCSTRHAHDTERLAQQADANWWGLHVRGRNASVQVARRGRLLRAVAPMQNWKALT